MDKISKLKRRLEELESEEDMLEEQVGESDSEDDEDDSEYIVTLPDGTVLPVTKRK